MLVPGEALLLFGTFESGAHSLAQTILLVIALGVGAQWISWRIGVPSILLLLVIGFAAGATGLIKPDESFGDLLLPVVSISVSLILYEGGLSLRFRELGDAGAVVRNLCSIGAIATWAICAAAAHWLLGFDVSTAVLLGAVLIVTGPTVIIPLLEHIRPTGAAAKVLKWEGIVIDPIGAMLAVLVFDVLLLKDPGQAAAFVGQTVVLTVVVGSLLGIAGGVVLALAISRFWVPDKLQNAVSLMLVLCVYGLSDAVVKESGLFSATIMGIFLANQRIADVRHIVEFKENLRVLLISSLFIVLAARVQVEDALTMVGLGPLVFVMVLVVVARPISVLVSTMRSSLSFRERTFLMWMAPRGIVAASVASVFALRLEEAGFEQAGRIIPTTFLVIVATVLFYGLSAGPVARKLGLAVKNPHGVLFLGASSWVREIAAILKKLNVPVFLVDSNRSNVQAAKMAGLPCHQASVLSEHLLDDIDLAGLGKCLAVTPNDWVNTLASQRMRELFGRAGVYQLRPQARATKDDRAERHLYGRLLFGEDVGYGAIDERVREGAVVKATRLSEEFTMDGFRQRYGDKSITLFVLEESGRLEVITHGSTPEPEAGDTIIAIVDDKERLSDSREMAAMRAEKMQREEQAARTKSS